MFRLRKRRSKRKNADSVKMGRLLKSYPVLWYTLIQAKEESVSFNYMDTNKLSGKLDDKLEVMCDGLAAPILED